MVCFVFRNVIGMLTVGNMMALVTKGKVKLTDTVGKAIYKQFRQVIDDYYHEHNITRKFSYLHKRLVMHSSVRAYNLIYQLLMFKVNIFEIVSMPCFF